MSLSLVIAACSSGLSAYANDVFTRLAAQVPWELSEQPAAPLGCSQVVDIEMCGAFILRVKATDTVVLDGLPEVVRGLGFSNNVRTEGCRNCPQEPTVIGVDGSGRELAITVYPIDDESAMLDAYVSAPPT